MKLTLAEPKYIKDSIAIISEIVTEGTFKITPEGIELIAMDAANVAMVIFKLFSSSFVEYDIKNNVDIAINLNNFKAILRRTKPNDMVTLELGDDNKLKIILKSDTVRTFSIPIIELEDKEQKVPDLKFTSVIHTKAERLTNAIEDVDIIAESVQLHSETGKLTFRAEGDLSHAKIEISAGSDTNISISGDANVKSKYSIEYLKKMIPAAKLADAVSINFSNDYPLKLDYVVLDKLAMSFILAPRVEND